jgi:pimeloyl-ACP methyl ester carboxylesterase
LSTFVQLKERRIGYWSAGSGAAVILIHGSFATSSAWKRLAAQLEASARCVALDLPGWGESDPMPKLSDSLDFEVAAVEALARRCSASPTGWCANAMSVRPFRKGRVHK